MFQAVKDLGGYHQVTKYFQFTIVIIIIISCIININMYLTLMTIQLFI